MTSIAKGRSTAVASLERYREQLSAQIAKLRAELHAVEESLSVLRGEGVLAPSAATPGGPYAAMGLQEAVNTALKGHPTHFFTAAQIASYLRRKGFARGGKTFGPQVFSALNRAARNKRKRTAVREKHQGKVVFRYYDMASAKEGTEKEGAVAATTATAP